MGKGLIDIVDSLTRGAFYKNNPVHGHGTVYFKEEGNRYAEIFAQMFYLRGTKYWGYVEENFPSLSKKFIELIDEGLK